MGRRFSLAVNPHSIKMHEERASRQKDDETVPKGAIPAYLMDREGESRSKVRSRPPPRAGESLLLAARRLTESRRRVQPAPPVRRWHRF